MKCNSCSSERMITISGKTNDLCYVEINSRGSTDYVPSDIGIGGGDYIKFSYCLNCGQIKGEWPVEKTEVEYVTGISRHTCRSKQCDWDETLEDVYCDTCPFYISSLDYPNCKGECSEGDLDEDMTCDRCPYYTEDEVEK